MARGYRAARGVAVAGSDAALGASGGGGIEALERNANPRLTLEAMLLEAPGIAEAGAAQ